MSELVLTGIEGIVGVERHPTEHYGRAVSAEGQVYVLHSRECIDALTSRTSDLRECRFSRALDSGIDPLVWDGAEDRPVRLAISSEWGDLEPVTENGSESNG